MVEQILTISFLDQSIRIDKYLATQLPYSRQQIIKFLKNGSILVNDKIVKPQYLIKVGDKIRISRDKLNIPNYVELTSMPLIPEPPILYEDSDLIAINKPANIIVHPTSSVYHEPTIANWLIYRWPELRGVGDNPLRPGIVHRLDRDTSGVLLIAKNQSTFLSLKTQFQKRQVHKEYLVLVYGFIKPDRGIINFSLGKSKKSPFRRKIVLPSDKQINQKEAITEFEVIERFSLVSDSSNIKNIKSESKFTLLNVRPKTGRTHQIRVHLASLGFPVVGDKEYGKKKPDLAIPVARQFLHAWKISFNSLSGQNITIKASLSCDLKKALTYLRQHRQV